MAAHETREPEPTAQQMPRAGLPAEILFLLVIGCLTVFFSLAGIPGTPTPVAGDGSDALRQGWAERRTADVSAAGETAPHDETTPRGR